MKEILGIKLYTAKETQKMLGVSEITFRRYIQNGEIVGRKLGVSYYFTEKAIIDFLHSDSKQFNDADE